MAGIAAALPILLNVIEAAKVVIPAGTEAFGKFTDLERKVKAMRDSGREPTTEEFHELQAETEQLTNRLEAANSRLGGN